MDEQEKRDAPEREQLYEPPRVDDVPSEDGQAVTAAGFSK